MSQDDYAIIQIKIVMEEIVQKFIYSQPDGVMLAEMEEYLRQSRLRLGYVTRKLMDEGKIVKIENKYFPVAGYAVAGNESK